MDSDIFYINIPHPTKNLASHIPNTTIQTSHVLNISQWEHPMSTTFHIHSICHAKHLTFKISYILFLKPHILKIPHSKYSKSQRSNISKIPHSQHPISPTSHISNVWTPQHLVYSIYLTSPTSLIPYNPHTQDTTFWTSYTSNISHLQKHTSPTSTFPTF